MSCIIITPTRISAAAVACAGMARNRGAKSNATAKQMAAVKLVSPERPPTFTPEALSTKVVVVLEPKQAPRVVATASAVSIVSSLGIEPSLFTIPAFSHTPTRVPSVSKRSMKSNVNTRIIISTDSSLEKSKCMAIGAIEGGVQKKSWI